MDDKTLQILNELANKFGTTTEYLWGVLLKQAPINGCIDVLFIIGSIITTTLLFQYVLKKTSSPPKTAENIYPEAEWDDEFVIILSWTIVVFAILFTIVTVPYCLSDAITSFLNPEYWALKQIIG